MTTATAKRPTMYRCPWCDIDGMTRHEFRRHRERDCLPEEQRRIACEDCGQEFIWWPAYVRHRAQVHRQRRKDNAAVAQRNSAPNLADRCFYRTDRYDALRNETIAGTGPFFNEPVVVSLHASKFKLRVLQPAKSFAGKPGHRWIEYGIVDA